MAKTIMIVEDDDEIRETLGMLAELEGYTAVLARNGREALDLLRNRPDRNSCCLIFLDLMMPEMNGWEFLEVRNHQEKMRAVPVVIMSAVSDKARMPEGAVKILGKPMELEVIRQSMHELCCEEENPDRRAA